MKNFKNISIAIIGVLCILVTFLLVKVFTQPTTQEQTTQEVSLSEQLTEVYIQKREARLKKSDLLVLLAESEATTAKYRAELELTNQTITNLNQKEIDLSMTGIQSLEAMMNSDK